MRAASTPSRRPMTNVGSMAGDPFPAARCVPDDRCSGVRTCIIRTERNPTRARRIRVKVIRDRTMTGVSRAEAGSTQRLSARCAPSATGLPADGEAHRAVGPDAVHQKFAAGHQPAVLEEAHHVEFEFEVLGEPAQRLTLARAARPSGRPALVTSTSWLEPGIGLPWGHAPGSSSRITQPGLDLGGDHPLPAFGLLVRLVPRAAR